MNIGKIEVLIRAIELGSLSKAACEYLYTPSAVSHILDNVENELGIRFIKRTHKGIEIEDGCEEIVENLKNIIRLKKQTMQIIAKKNKIKNKLIIATYASISKHILPRIIKGFNIKYPDTDVSIMVVENMKEVYENGLADILIGEMINGDSICWEELLCDPYVAVFPKSYRITGNTIKREELYNMNFVMANDTKISQYIDKSRLNRVININSHDDSSVIHIVKEELGVAVLPGLSVMDNESVRCLDLEPPLVRKLGILYGINALKKKKELRDFIEHIRTLDFKYADERKKHI